MNEIIPFKKSIILKSQAYKITDISLKHNYKIEKGIIVGTFNLYGTYKITQGSILDEDFMYDIPFSIALGDRIDKSSVELLLDEFNYSLKDDALLLDIKMKMNYEEVVRESVEELINDFKEEKKELNIIENNEKNYKTDISDINILTNNLKDTNNFVTYKIYIAKDNDTFETISNKYNVLASDIKEYNKTENIVKDDKIIVPLYAVK